MNGAREKEREKAQQIHTKSNTQQNAKWKNKRHTEKKNCKFVCVFGCERLCTRAHTFTRLLHSRALCARKCNVKSFITSLGLVIFFFCLLSLSSPIFNLFVLYLFNRAENEQMNEWEIISFRGRLSNRMTEVLKRGDMSLINCTVSEKRSLPNVELKSE